MIASMAAALRALHSPPRVVGVARSDQTRAYALGHDIVDEALAPDDAGLDVLLGPGEKGGADVVVLATPVAQPKVEGRIGAASLVSAVAGLQLGAFARARGRAQAARIILIVVPGLPLEPWYLVTTDLELDPCQVVQAYDGRYQIEVNFDEVKELGLGHYQGRSGQGVRRRPPFLCVAQTLLKL